MKNIPVIIASNPDYRQTVHLRRNAQKPVCIRPAAAYLQPGPVLRYKVGDSVVGEYFARFVLRITAGLSAASGIAAGRAVRGRTRSARQDHAPAGLQAAVCGFDFIQNGRFGYIYFTAGGKHGG